MGSLRSLYPLTSTLALILFLPVLLPAQSAVYQLLGRDLEPAVQLAPGGVFVVEREGLAQATRLGEVSTSIGLAPGLAATYPIRIRIPDGAAPR